MVRDLIVDVKKFIEVYYSPLSDRLASGKQLLIYFRRSF